ncbi:hypothetical protein V6N13_139875 [Hibiscus sabdariffa]|uniref:Uncharacterized protein n=2 Tax=Hibiscus sabdariffa TaxID=183260 RepID=A0ABR1ZL25_9ROSI
MEVTRHFLHSHPLVLTETNDSFYCSGCGKGISGSFYGCFPCMYYLHESCAQLPQRVHNFFHTCPLLLTVSDHLDWTCNACFKRVSGFSYRCIVCDFDMHVECVQRPTIESQELIIQHFTHWHPLKLVDSDRNLEVRDLEGCRVPDNSGWHECSHNSHWWEPNNSCWFKCSDNSYWFDLSEKSYWVEGSHNSYWFEGSPSSCWSEFYWWCVRSYNSYQCEGCDEVGSGLAFRCGKCNLQLDVKCALLPTVESKGADKIQHSAHKHPLVLCQGKEFTGEVRCRACGENCLLDSDPCFGCSTGSSTVTFPSGSDDSHEGSDLAYRCVECGFQLDVKCALFPTIEAIDADKIMHCAHKDPLALGESKAFGNEVRCGACGESTRILFWLYGMQLLFAQTLCYGVASGRERERSIIPLIPSPSRHPRHFHMVIPFNVLHAWGRMTGFCCGKCNFDLHIDCAKPNLTTFFKYEGQRHHLTYFDKTLIPIQCNICHDDVQSCFFRCVACSYNTHIYFIPSTPRKPQQPFTSFRI